MSRGPRASESPSHRGYNFGLRRNQLLVCRVHFRFFGDPIKHPRLSEPWCLGPCTGEARSKILVESTLKPEYQLILYNSSKKIDLEINHSASQRGQAKDLTCFPCSLQDLSVQLNKFSRLGGPGGHRPPVSLTYPVLAL